MKINIKTFTILTLFSSIMFITGCEVDRRRGSDGSIKIVNQTQYQPRNITDSRFMVKSFGGFNAGHNDHYREILEITDVVTGKKYIGITGVGISEDFRVGKITTSE